MKHKLISILPLTIFLGFFYIFGMYGSLDVDKITVQQFAVRVSITLLYMVIATATYKIIEGKEEAAYE